MQVGWQGLGCGMVVSIEILFGIYIGALKMQVGWEGLRGLASPREFI